MKKRRLVLAGAGALGALCALAAALAGSSAGGGGLALLSGAGKALRALSLSGALGNLCAWALVFLLSAPPALWMLLHRRRHGARRADYLAVLSALLLLGGWYALANPTLLGGAPALLPGSWSLLFWAAAGSVLVCWAVLRMLDRLEHSGLETLSSALSILLTGLAALMVFSAVFAACAALFSLEGQARGDSNSDWFLLNPAFSQEPGAARTGGSALLTAAVVVLDLIPNLMGAAVLLWGTAFTDELGRETFGAAALALCEKTAAGCRRVVQASVGLAVCSNLLQLLAAPQALSVSLSVHIPLTTLLLSAALLALCRCLQRGRELQQDSDSII